MKIRSLLSTSLDPLSPDDTVETALATLLEQGVGHLPVVDEHGTLVGLISEEQLLEAPESGVPVRSMLRAHPVSIHPGEHVFNATRTMVQHNLSVLPVTAPPKTGRSDANGTASPAPDTAETGPASTRTAPQEAAEHYLGVVRRHDLFDQFARMLSTQEPGAILALEVEAHDYSLAQLVHLIEQSSAKVLSVASESSEGENGPRRVTVKLDTTDTARIRHMLEHHGYDIVASFGEQDDQILERVQQFMRYLEV